MCGSRKSIYREGKVTGFNFRSLAHMEQGEHSLPSHRTTDKALISIKVTKATPLFL